jgi:sialidase-1
MLKLVQVVVAGLPLLLLSKFAAGDQVEAPRQVTLFRAGDGRYANYRIPAMICTARNTILAFCEGRQTPPGPGNDSGEINLLLRRSTDGGATFTPVQIVWSDGRNTCGNPCPVVDRSTGRIWLLATHNLGEDREREITLGTAKGTRTVWLSHSDDDGVTWSAFREITQDVKEPDWAWFATGPGIGIQIEHGPHAGRLVVPCDYVAKGGGGDNSNSVVIYSDDHGNTWKVGGQPPQHGFNESQIVELSDGHLMLNMRNTAPRKGDTPHHNRGVAISEDGGLTFGHAYFDDTLIEPRCQASILRLSWPQEGKSRILFSNPASQHERKMMTVRMSYDDGRTWLIARQIFSGWSAYSSLVKLQDGSVGLLYEAGDKKGYERIDFARFTLRWLSDGKDDGR